MKLQGNPRYTSLVDQEALIAFLKKYGASDEKIAKTNIRFVRTMINPVPFMKPFLGEPRGRAQHDNTIIVATGWMEQEEDRQEALQELNAILLHECIHLTENGTIREMYGWISIAITVLTYAFMLHVAGMFLEQINRVFSAIIILLLSTLGMIPFIFLFYRLNPGERRATRIMWEDPAWVLKEEKL